jgi:hypothetical protein
MPVLASAVSVVHALHQTAAACPPASRLGTVEMCVMIKGYKYEPETVRLSTASKLGCKSVLNSTITQRDQ